MQRRSRRPFAVIALAVAAPLALVACGDDDDGGSGATTVPSETTVPGSTTGPAGAGDVTIVIDDVAFTTPEVTVQAGGTVTFDNQDNQAHTATGEGSSFATDTIRPGESKTITFDEPGTFPFICSFHPFMKGTVTVE